MAALSHSGLPVGDSAGMRPSQRRMLLPVARSLHSRWGAPIFSRRPPMQFMALGRQAARGLGSRTEPRRCGGEAMKLINRRHAISGIAAAASSIALPTLGQSDRRIVLGQSAAFTGAAAQLGIQMNRGARLHFDAVNAAGGINGLQIELRTLDDQYEPDKCKANTETFVKDDIFALFGYVGTPTSLAALPLVNQHRIPFFGPFTGAEALRDPFSRYVFHVRASYYDETALIVKQLTALDLKKIAVFRQNDSYGQAGYDGMVRALKARNLEPIAVGLV